MERKLALNTLARDNASYGKHFSSSRAASSQHGPREYLNALFLTLQNLRVDVNRVADFKFWWVFF